MRRLWSHELQAKISWKVTHFLVWEFPHKPNLLKPPHHQQNQIKLPSLQASHIFLHNVFASLIFPHQRFPKKTQSAKPLKQQENAAIKYTDPDRLTQNSHSRKKRENTHQQKRTNKQTKNHQNPSTLSKNNTQNHREEAILVSEKKNTLITSFPATCNLFIYFFFFSFLNTEVSWMVRIEPPSSNDQKCFFGRYRSGTIEFSLWENRLA